jgi:hypothetical protein
VYASYSLVALVLSGMGPPSSPLPEKARVLGTRPRHQPGHRRLLFPPGKCRQISRILKKFNHGVARSTHGVRVICSANYHGVFVTIPVPFFFFLRVTPGKRRFRKPPWLNFFSFEPVPKPQFWDRLISLRLVVITC